MQAITIPPLDLEAGKKAARSLGALEEFTGELGLLPVLAGQYAAMRGIDPSALQKADETWSKLRPALILMCGDHGITKYGVSAFPQEVTLQMINGYMRQTAGASVLARHAGADVYVCDVGTAFDLSEQKGVYHRKVAWGTEDFTSGPAMSKEQAEAALQAGMEMADIAIEAGHNLLYTGEMGIGNTTSTAAIAAAYLGLDPVLTVGRGSGINDARLKVKRQVVAKGLAVNKPKVRDAMDVLCKVGGYDHAGLAGAIIGGARRRIPTVVDGCNATAAALIAVGLYPGCRNYLFCSHKSSDLSQNKMLEELQLQPIVDAGLRLGEGTGASLAIPVLQAALDLYTEAGRCADAE